MDIDTQRLVDLRVSKGWSQAETARQAGINQSYYSAIERGKRKPSMRVVLRIADALGAYLLDLHPPVAVASSTADLLAEHEEAGDVNPTDVVIERVKVMDLNPGDVLVVTVPERTTVEEAEYVDAAVRRRLPDLRVLVVTANVDLAAYRPKDES